MSQIHLCYIINFIVHLSSHFLQSTLNWSCFISFPSVHTSLIMFHFYFLQLTVHVIHFIYHSPSRSYLPCLGGHTGIPRLCTQMLDTGLWRLDSSRWTLDAGHWTLNAGPCTLDSRRWTLGRYTLDFGRSR